MARKPSPDYQTQVIPSSDIGTNGLTSSGRPVGRPTATSNPSSNTGKKD